MVFFNALTAVTLLCTVAMCSLVGSEPTCQSAVRGKTSEKTGTCVHAHTIPYTLWHCIAVQSPYISG